MAKSIIKEVIIILLLLLAVILALGVLFYDYIPNNKTVPSVQGYKTSDSVSKEIAEQITEDEAILVTYRITADDLKQLEITKDYNKGKANPFSTYEDPKTENKVDENGNPIDNPIGGDVSTSSGNSSSGNTFYKNTGTK